MFHATRHAEFCGQCNKLLSPEGEDKVFIGGFCESCFNLLTHPQINAVVDQTYVQDVTSLLGQLDTRLREYQMDKGRLNNGRESA